MSYQTKVTDKITEFIRGFGLPQTLKEAGADISPVERMAEEAMGDGQMYGSPHEADYERSWSSSGNCSHKRGGPHGC
ncbi:MAG: hypothetical protein MUP40_03895 [Actinobacteria bacterium]|nr:hypothetical protein [Actinomycetota bacterium]